MKKVALALGGGGARGLAHIKILEFFDRNKITISRISGASIGSIIGALYASGKSAQDIQEKLDRYTVIKDHRKRDMLKKIPDLLVWLGIVKFDLKGTGLVRTEKFLEFLLSDLDVKTFEDLDIPLTLATTDFWTGEEVILNSGPLLPAIMASMAIPGVFPPVEHQGRVLVDGSLANSVPYSHHLDGEDVSIAIDVAPDRAPGEKRVPKLMDASMGMFDMLIDKLAHHQREHIQPEIYLRPGIRGVGIFDFDKIESIYEQAETIIPELEKKLASRNIEI